MAWQTDTPANGGPDTGAEMWATVRIGWNYGMRFLEVQNVDVVNPDMQAPLACANQAMLTRRLLLAVGLKFVRAVSAHTPPNRSSPALL